MTLGSPDDLQGEPHENNENRQYLKTGVAKAKETGQWVYEEANKRAPTACGKAVTACDTIMGMTSTVVNAVVPKSVLAWLPTSMEQVDEYVDKADNRLDGYLQTENGRWVEEKTIEGARIVQDKATELRETAIQKAAAVSKMKDTVVEKAQPYVTMVKDAGKTVVETATNPEVLSGALSYTVEQASQLAQAQLDTARQVPAKISEGITAVRALPAKAIATAIDYTDYDGDGKVTMQDVVSSAKEAYGRGTAAVRSKLDEGIDYYMPQVGEEAPADGDDEAVDEATRVSLSSKFMQRLLGNIKSRVPGGQYLGQQSLAIGVEAMKYIDYLKGLELKDLPVPEAGQENLKKVIDIAASKVAVFRDALFNLFASVKGSVDLESYKGEIYKPLENITPYFSRLAQERSIEQVPSDVLNVAACLFMKRNSTPEVNHLAESIEKMLYAVFDVTVLFSKSGAKKDG